MKRLDRNRIENILALTPLQEGMLFHYLQDPQSELYIEQLSLAISGEIDVGHFEKAWNTVIEVNEMLRSVFHWEKLEKPSLIILKEHKCKMIFYDFSDKDSSRKKSVLEEIKNKDRRETFDLHQVPFRVTLCRLGAKEFEMVVSNHHILYDGWSNGVILKEFFNAYHELCNGGLPLNIPAKPPFKEFIRWIQSQNKNRQEKFWKEYLAGVETQTELPIKKRTEETARTEDYSIILEEDIKGKLDVFVKNNRVTLAPVFYTAWGILLQKYCDSEDVIFGTTVSGRSAGIKGIEDMVGLFINTIPLRTQTTPREKIGDVVFRTDKVMREREAFEHTPLVDIGSYSSVGGGGLLFNTIVVIENYPLDDVVRRDVARNVSTVYSYSMVEMTHYDLTVGIILFNEIEIKFSFNRELFEKDAVENLAGHFKGIIRNIIENPELELSQLEIISYEEKKRVLFEFNNTGVEYPVDRTIYQLFEEQAARTPDSVGLVGPVGPVGLVGLTYRELNEQSGGLAGLLIEKGVLPDNIVGIMMERSVETVIGIFGILKSGGAYLPIDPGYPQERIDYMLKDSAAKILLTAADYVFNFQHSSFIIHHSSLSSHLAYVIYTSGSTGKPKGVLIEHASVVNRLSWEKEKYGLNERDVVLQSAPFIFDVSVCELFRWIPAGARLCLLPSGAQMDPERIVNTIARYGATTADFVPSVISLILDQADKHRSYRGLSSLRWMFTGVETVGLNLVKRFRETLERFNDTKLINAYGPTESTVDVTHFQCTGDYDTVPIGKPMANVRVYIVDRWGNLQPMGIGGELCIAGKGLARGYLNNPELTAEKFILPSATRGAFEKAPAGTDPQKLLINDHSPLTTHHSPLYKTGDRARWLNDGNIEFLGRMDHQVKIRGFRVELGEIESRLLNHPGVKEVVVLAREEERGDKYLCAYVVSNDENVVSELREYLAEELPEYMIPAYFMRLEKIPLTPSGKVDRKTLPEPVLHSGTCYVAPRDEIEGKLVGIWSEVLHITSIGIDDNFFRLGGHSLKATALVLKIHKEFDVKVPLTEIFKNPRIRELAKYIKEKSKEFHIALEPAEEKGYYELSPAQKRLYIMHQLVSNDTGYNMPIVIPLVENIEKEKVETVFKKLVERHESLRTSFITVNEMPVQRIHRGVDFSIGYYEIKEEAEVAPLIAGFTMPFQFDTPPLLRVNLVKVDAARRFLFIDTHHIITDGTSLDILEREFAALCSGEELPVLRFRYRDYSEWHHKTLQQEAIKKQEAHWLKEFSGEIPVLDLPTDYPRLAEQGIEGNTALFSLDSRETRILKAVAQQNDVTLYMALLAVFSILFAKLGGQEDIIIGTPIAARRHTDLQPIIGMFVNSLALRNYPSGEKPLKHYLNEVKQQTLAAYENQEYPFEELVEHLAVNRDTGRNPVFDVMLNLLNQGTVTSAGDNREFKDQPPYPHQKATSRFDMAFSAMEQGERLVFGLEYSTRLFTPATIDRFIGYLKTIVLSLNKDQKLSEVEFIPAEEKQAILEMCNGVKELDAPGETIHRLFEEQAARTPDRIALVGANAVETLRATSLQIQISYRQLNEQANRLAHLLREKGIGPDKVVGLMVERSVEMIIALLAVLKAGGAYLPMDTEYPAERVLLMLADAAIPVLLTQEKLLRRFAVTSLKGMKTGPKDGGLVVTPPRGQIKDLDMLPKPDRTLVNYKKYHQSIGIAMAKHTISIQATRGCPFNCAFCHKIWPKTHVTRSAQSILEEIRCCYGAGVKRFVFIDDIFNLDKRTSGKVLETIINQNLDIQLFFPNGLRGDILDKDFIDLMVQAGTVNIDLALETASPRIQKLIHKNLNLEKFAENIGYIIDKYPRVLLEMELMIGFPTETEKEALLTFEFLKDLKWVHFPNLNILKIYPNTEMYRLARENGIGDNVIQRSVNLAYHELPDALPFSKTFVKEYQTRFMNEYLLSKERLLHVLPYQMKTLTGDELVQKYNSYLPVDIKSFADIIDCAGITREELGNVTLLPADHMAAPDFGEKVGGHFPAKEKADNPFKVLLLDLSLFFSEQAQGSHMLYDMIEEPLGLMYLLSYLNEQFKGGVWGKIAKSRIDFDSFDELKSLLKEFKPHLIGIRTLSYYKEFFHRTVLMIRHWGIDAPIAAGGPYATSDYRSILQDNNVDLVVLGEGELTLAQLVGKMIENNYRLPGQDVLKEIPGMAFSTGSYTGREIVLLDDIMGRLNRYPAANPPYMNRPDDLLYLIYTSGSTGMPKGVMVEHRNLVNLFKFQFKYTDIDCSRILQFSTISFDASFHEIFSAFLSGGRLFLVDKDTRTDVPELFRLIERNGIKTVFLPISFLKVIFKEEEYIKRFPRSIRHIQTAGEQVVIGTHFKNFLREGQVYLHNHYGPSETHVVTTLTIDPGGDIAEFPTIGKPLQNTSIYIVDKWGHLLPPGAAGELLIGGVQVGRGYLNRPELTAKRFVAHELHELKQLKQINKFFGTSRTPISKGFWAAGGILYRTGDLARFLPDGNIEFLGRIDHQVKIRGFRVEPGEIESRLLNVPGLKQAVVLVREEESRDKYICAYIVSDREIGVSELREHLAKDLPDYMIPAYFVQLEKMPLTVSGKIDRGALRGPGLKAGESYTAPGNELETKLVDIWADILDISDSAIGVSDNFFQLGGHSLKAIILAAKIHKVFEVKIPLSEIFKHPRIRELAGYLKDAAPWKYEQVELAEKKEYYALSSAQRRLYFLQQMDKDGTAYNLPSIMVLEGMVDKDKLEHATQKLIRRHESLRTSIELVREEPMQRIHEHKDLATEVNNHHSSFIIHHFIRAFDLSKAPLLRVGLVKLEEEKHLLMVDMHHIISDGLSTQVLLRDFSALYTGMELPEIGVQYKDYAEWQNRERVGKKIPEQGEYWQKEFAGEIPVLELPTDYVRPAAQGFEGNSIDFEIDSETCGALNALALEAAATLYMALLTVYTIFLARLSNREDLVVGSPVAGRRHTDLEKIIGMFVNTLALRNYPEGEKKYVDFLREVKERTLKAFENQEYQYEDLVEKVAVKRDISRNPLFDTVFALQNTGIQKIEIPGLKLSPYEYENKTSKFDLTLLVVEEEGKLYLTFEYSTKLFKRETVERFIVYFKNIVRSIVENRNRKIFELEILTAEEKHRILFDFNDTEREYDRDKTIQQLFEDQVTKAPHRIALVGAGEGEEKKRRREEEKNGDVETLRATSLPIISTHLQITYRQLNELSNRLAHDLRKKGIGAGEYVGVVMDRSMEMTPAVMGILKAGGAYAPLESYLPDLRIEKILASLKAKCVITDNSNRSRLEVMSEALECLNHNICLEELKENPVDNPAPASGSRDIAYVIYTSGSTGTPKGVVETHRPVVNVIQWVNRTFDVGVNDKLLFVASLGFDLSVYDIFGILASGGSIRTAVTEDMKEPTRLLEIMVKEGITFWDSAPAALQQLVPFFSEVREAGKITALRLVFLSGDWIPVSMPDALRDTFKGVGVIALGGATEATIWSNYYPIGDVDPSWPSIPYGKPIQNAKYYILDKSLRPCPIRTGGDLYIGGECLATEYKNDPALTAVKFIADPFCPGEKIYKTGDMARWLDDGNIQFLGRQDHQVKIRGFRIELGEIESRLANHPLVKEALVLAREEEKDDKYLCAYIISDSEVVMSELREYLAKELPDYMIPPYFVQIETIPLTPNGKLDRGALPKPGLKVGEIYTAPRNEIEKKLVELWAEVLGGDMSQTAIGIDDNFFQLGGHSLKATVLVSKIHKVLNVKVPLLEIFISPTVRGLAGYIQNAVGEQYVCIAPVEKKEYYELSSAQKRLYFLQQMELESTVYNITSVMTLAGRLDMKAFEEVFTKLIERHESLRTSFIIISEEPVQRIQNKSFCGAFFKKRPLGEPPEAFIKKFVRPFDLSQAPLLRVELQGISEEESLLMVDMHHIISDGTSMGILIKEFMALYEGKELAPLKVHYKDYARNRESLITQEKFWLGQFAEEIPVLNLPLDYARPLVQDFEGNHVFFELTVAETSSLKALALKQGVTLYMLLLAVCNTWLSKLGGEDDIIIGTPVAGRRHVEYQDIVGMFVNTLALRNFPAPGRAFADFITEIKKRTLEAFQNQDYPFEELVDRVVKDRDTSRNPLFDVMFVFQNTDTPQIEIPGLILKPYEFENKAAKFDLTLDGMEKDGKLSFSLEYAARLFKEETARGFCAYFKNIINPIIGNPVVRIADIEILGQEEKAKILEIANGVEGYVDISETIHGMFEKVAPVNKDKVALIFRDGRLTYGEVNRKADELAHLLRNNGVGGDSIVALMVKRSFELVIAMLGIMKAGGAYLPIDPNFPQERIDYMLKDSAAKLSITTNDKDDFIIHHANNLSFHHSSFDLPRIHHSNLCYLIYTSGSTGKPKGVMLEHTNLVNLMEFQYKFTRIDFSKVLQFTTMSFDVSFQEIFSTLLAGGELYLIDEDTRNSVPELFRLIVKNKIKTLFFPMSFLKMIFSSTGNDDLPAGNIEHIVTAGEQLVVDDRFREYLEKNRIYLHNHYGPSETHVITALTMSPGEDIPQFPTIGKPVMNTGIYILDKGQRLLPAGVAGELYAGGLQVGRGYLNNPELTREKFKIINDKLKIKNGSDALRADFHHSSFIIHHSILYRTGDLARRPGDGNIEFLGRIDHQVKIRGIRVEPGEIENRLKQIDYIKDAAVVVKQDSNGDKYLCAYVVANKEMNLDIPALRNTLADGLPQYMIPAYFTPIDKIPLTPSGKLDRRGLPEPDMKKEEISYTAPRDHIEKELLNIWSEILGKESSIGITDNFFRLGGHSLKAIGMVNRIQKKLGVKIAIQTLFQFPTIAEIAGIIKNSKSSAPEEIEKLPEQPYYEMSYAQKRMWYIIRGNPRNTAYNMPVVSTFYETVDEGVVRRVLEYLTTRHESLRTYFKYPDEEPVQVIEAQDTALSKLDFAVLDVSSFAQGEKENQRRRIIKDESTHIFNLEQGPLFRARLVKCAAHEFDFIFNIHHIVSDGVSLEVLKKEFFQVYKAYKKGMTRDLEPLKIRYQDYAAWQNRLLANEEKMGRAKESWKNFLNNAELQLDLHYDFSYAALNSMKSSAYCLFINEEISKPLRLLAEERKGTLFIVLLAAFNILLSHITYRDQVMVGIPAAARQHWGLQNIIGLFVNTLILQGRVDTKETFNQFLAQYQADALNVLEYQDFPLEVIFAELKIKYPEISAFFNMLNIGTSAEERIEPFENYHIEDIQETKFPIHCYITEYKNGIQVECHYFRELFRPGTIEKIMGIYERILENISASPMKKIKDLVKKME
ncbi:MAG: amino acid adenylation domain-containing protein [Candidatus Aminicenantes bacterium]|nr:amino acid adenylation domain-containing protein [Candidatus Aminicenantes bacterium]